MSVTGIERDVETAIKARLVAANFTTTDGDGNSKAVVYRTWLVDDESADADEDQDFPCVEIMTSPAANTGGYQSMHWDVPVEIRCMTHHEHDRKRTILTTLYENVRVALEYTGLSGFSRIGSGYLLIDQPGESGLEENLQYMTMRGTVKCCGTA